MQKLYVYVDESGQDTEGLLFVVGILIMEKHIDEIERLLLGIERTSGKGSVKWRHSPFNGRKQYLEEIITHEVFRQSLFFEIFQDSKNILS